MIPRKVLHVNWDQTLGLFWIKKSFNLVFDPAKAFTQNELDEYIRSNPEVRVVVRYK